MTTVAIDEPSRPAVSILPFSSRTAMLERMVLAVAAASTLLYFGVILSFSSTTSFYTLDDPYIHLAMAENIARGHFGINLGEVSNPSSSIVWPWLMAAFEPIGLMLWAPLLVNVACFLATLSLLFGYTLRTLAPDGRGAVPALIVVAVAFFSFNLFGVIFTGMEHSLHALVSVAAVSRLIEKRYDRVALVACIAGPLVRFEGLLVLAFCLGAAITDRKYAFAAMAMAGVTVGIGAYELMLHSLGLPVLPSSVLAKSYVSADAVDGRSSLIAAFADGVRRSFHRRDSLMYGAFAAALAWASIRRTGRDRLIALGMLALLAVIYLVRPVDPIARYDVFLFCIAAVACLHLLQGPLRRLLASHMQAVALSVALISVNGAFGLYVLAVSPMGARNIHRQQHQLHRFIEDCWKKPIAINDLGWSSFRNDGYVLDLAGLGNEAARRRVRTMTATSDRSWMVEMADAHHVDVAAIYPDWFWGGPPGWTRVGELVITDDLVTPAFREVAFFARPGAEDGVRGCLQWLGSTTPAGAVVILQPR